VILNRRVAFKKEASSMKITYIGHSGFLMEWKNCYWLFDYYTGELPAMNPEKKLIVFASHKHGDHFNPVILRLAEQYPRVEYVLSNDIRVVKSNIDKYGVGDELLNRILSVKPNKEYELSDTLGDTILLTTLKSTDCGVAFILEYQGYTIYHAGDLNHWVWKEETKQSNNDMTAKFNLEIEKLRDRSIDIAFAPLDPRQEEWYYLGLEKLLNTARVGKAFPMHFWGKPEIILQYKQERGQYLKGTEVIEVNQPGQSWTINLD
jgi:L-ascorbate metabolism protein UlaG (beta-lactamase superfamily)